MNEIRVNRYLKLLAGLLVLVSAAVAAWGAMPRPGSGDANPPRPARRTASRMAAAPPLDAFEDVWLRPLQRPVIEPPPQPLPEEGPPLPPVTRPADLRRRLQLRLVGTILEAGRSRAIFLGPDGRIDLKGVGQDLDIVADGVRVEEIQSANVVVSHLGEELTFYLPSEEQR